MLASAGLGCSSAAGGSDGRASAPSTSSPAIVFGPTVVSTEIGDDVLEAEMVAYNAFLESTGEYLSGVVEKAAFAQVFDKAVLQAVIALGPVDVQGPVNLLSDRPTASEVDSLVTIDDCVAVEYGTSTRYRRIQVGLVQGGDGLPQVTSVVVAQVEDDTSHTCVPSSYADPVTKKVERYLRATTAAFNDPQFVFRGSELDHTTDGLAESTWLATLHNLSATQTSYELKEEYEVDIGSFVPGYDEQVVAVQACRRRLGEATVIVNGNRRTVEAVAQDQNATNESTEQLLVWASGPTQGVVFEVLDHAPGQCWKGVG